MKQNHKTELAVISGLLLMVNIHLVTGSPDNPFIYRPGESGLGGLAALILHPLVHVSLYHFALDAGAFLFLWSKLQASFLVRTACLLISGVSSFLCVTVLAPEAATSGFCGLSGIAHGIMAVFCLEMTMDRRLRLAGILGLGLVGAKSAFEVVYGHGLFGLMHMGYCGTPVPASHLGGFLGGILGFALVQTMTRANQTVLKSLHLGKG